jgi:hypothetical protein
MTLPKVQRCRVVCARSTKIAIFGERWAATGTRMQGFSTFLCRAAQFKAILGQWEALARIRVILWEACRKGEILAGNFDKKGLFRIIVG